MGRHMLKKTSKLPCSVITPTSPIRTPSQRYSWGNLLFGSGNQSGYPVEISPSGDIRETSHRRGYPIPA